MAGGSFSYAGGNPIRCLARWDGSAWSPLGQPIVGQYIRVLTIVPGGDLLVGGLFSSIGGTAANMVARWNGSAWSALGAGLDRTVNALALLPGGDLVAGGEFYLAGGVPTRHIARWNGATWSPLDSGLFGYYNEGMVRALTVLPNGDLAAGGYFTTAGSAVSAYAARWSEPHCYANCDCSATPPVLNATDFICFLNSFASGDVYANCDHSTSPPVLNVIDFTCFLNKFAAGCP